MPRETMDREIRQLQDDILTLGSMVEKNIIDAMIFVKEPQYEAFPGSSNG